MTQIRSEIEGIVEPILNKWFPNDGQYYEAQELSKVLEQWYLSKIPEKKETPILNSESAMLENLEVIGFNQCREEMIK